MKKTILCTLAAVVALSASAEGYQVNTLSAKQLGMGHTSVSQKLDSESVWFNPAAAAFQDQKFSLSAGVTGIMATATCTTAYPSADLASSYTSATKYTSDNDMSTPLYLYANYKVNDRLAVGLSFNTPYGSSMNWGDDWAGDVLVQNINLTAYTAQPTVSYKLLNDRLSIGAGLMMSWGSFELSKSYPQDLGDYGVQDASLTLGGDAGMKMGVNVGVMFDVTDEWSVGASYRSKMMMVVDGGQANLDFVNELFPDTDMGSISSELPLPSTLSVGATFYPNERWTLSAELQFVQWSAYETLTVVFDDLGGMSVPSSKNYSNTMISRFGAQFQPVDWFAARLGFYVDESPVASDYMNPETPSMTKCGYTCGFSVSPCKSRLFSIDFAYAFIDSADPERAGSTPVTTESIFSANYTAKAHTASIGISLGF